MSQVMELLRLSAEDVNNVADAYAGYALFMQHSGAGLANGSSSWETTAPWLASNWLMGGILKSLVVPKDALPLFSSAALVYRQLQHPFWKVAALCGLDNELLRAEESVISYSPEVTPNEFLYEQFRLAYLMGTQYRHSDYSARLITSAGAFQLQRAGRLNLPLHLYLQALENPHLEADKFGDNNSSPLAILLNRVQESMALATTDTYHWHKLRGSVVPVEPEILAVCINAVRADGNQFDWIENTQQPAYAPLLVALNIVQANEGLQSADFSLA